MKKKYYRIGTLKEQSEMRQANAQSGNRSGDGDRWGFTDGVIVDDTIYVPLESLALKLDIPMEDMFCRELMEAYKKYQKRTGTWPIFVFDLWVEKILAESVANSGQ